MFQIHSNLLDNFGALQYHFQTIRCKTQKLQLKTPEDTN